VELAGIGVRPDDTGQRERRWEQPHWKTEGRRIDAGPDTLDDQPPGWSSAVVRWSGRVPVLTTAARSGPLVRGQDLRTGVRLCGSWSLRAV